MEAYIGETMIEATEVTNVTRAVKRVPCGVFSRVVGFSSMVKRGNYDHWNPGKIAEWNDRVPYDVDKMPSHPFVGDVEPAPVVLTETV